MKYKFKLPKIAKILLIIMTVAEVALSMWYILKITNVLSQSINIVLDVSNLLLFVLATVITSSFLSIQYTIGTNIKLKLLWFDLLANKVAVSKIVNIVYKKLEDRLLLSYICELPDPVIINITIDKSQLESFAKHLKSTNNKIIYIEEE